MMTRAVATEGVVLHVEWSLHCKEFIIYHGAFLIAILPFRTLHLHRLGL